MCPGTYQELLSVTGARRGLTIRGVSKWTAQATGPRDVDEYSDVVTAHALGLKGP